MKTNHLLVIAATAAVVLAACQAPGPADEDAARHRSSYYAEKGEKMVPTASKVDQRNPPPNATPTPPTQAAPPPGRY